MRRLLITAAGAAAAIVLLAFLVYFFIPDRQLEGVVTRGAESAGLTFTAKKFGKSLLPVGITATGVSIGTGKGTLLTADTLKLRLRLLPLLLGKVEIGYRLQIGAGQVRGELFPRGNGKSTLAVQAVKLEDLPFFPLVTGAQVKGELNASGFLGSRQRSATGELQVEVKKADLRGIRIGETPLPDAAYDNVRGALKISGGKASLESLTLQGEGLYVRLKGDLPASSPLAAAPLNLTLELMPKPDFLEKQKFVFLLLTKYQSSPGHYQIPIRGTVGKPAIQ
jgi:type II secretion system protein N